MIVNYLEELSLTLERFDLSKDDICIVGSAVLAVYDVRENNDIDIIVSPEQRYKVSKEHSSIKISENVETKNEISANNEIEMVKENNFQCYDSAAGENPFLRDLSDELLKRQDNGACVYPLDTFRVVGILDYCCAYSS